MITCCHKKARSTACDVLDGSSAKISGMTVISGESDKSAYSVSGVVEQGLCLFSCIVST
jgi:hypothetical protein